MNDTVNAIRAKPAQSATTNPKKDTFVEARHTLSDGYLLYGPGDNAFIALYPDEFLEIRKDAEDNNLAIHELQEANQAVTEKSLALAELLRNPVPSKADLKEAQDELDQALATLGLKSEQAKSKIEKITTLGADPNRLVELLPLTQARNARDRTFYVKAEKLKKAAADKRVYLVEGKSERQKRPAGKLLNGAQLNSAEVKRRIAENVIDKAKFEKKWKLKPKDGDDYAGQLFSDWSRSMGAPAKDFLERERKAVVDGLFGPVDSDPNDPHRKIDTKAEAQLMRWAAGAGLEANVQGFQGNLDDKRDKDWKSRFKRAAKAAQFNIKANAEASFALGEAKVDTSAFYPHYAGWHLSPSGAGIALDLGQFRLRGDMALYAVAGASLAIEASAGLMLTAGKQGLRGVPTDAKAVKAKANAAGKVELFAGLKEGIDLAGSLQWLNPEGFIDPKNPKRKDVTKTWGEYADVASVSAGVAGIEGLAASLGFEVGYRNGNFVIAAKASGCLGLGGSGSVACKVGADSIGQFFMCVAHQLKQADYSMLGDLMQPQVYKGYNQVLFLVQCCEHSLTNFVDMTSATIAGIGQAYASGLQRLKQNGEAFIHDMERHMRQGWGWFAYMPPEARGAMIASIIEIANQPHYVQNTELRQAAAFTVNELLATGQTTAHLANTLDRITVAIGDEGDRVDGIRKVNTLLENSHFAGGLDRALNQVASAKLLIQRPFMRNDEPSFIVAQMGFSHTMAMA